MAYNNVILIGRLVRDMEVREYERDNGEKFKVGTCNIAVDRPSFRKDATKETDFIPVKCFGGAATYLQKCGKGALVRLTGQIRTEKYTNKDGETKYTWHVLVNTFDGVEKLDPWKKAEDRERDADTKAQEQSNAFMAIPDDLDDSGLPFN